MLNILRAGLSIPARPLISCLTLSLLLVLGLPGCSQLPDYAAPTVHAPQAPVTNVFRYRNLKRNDFQADSPGQDFPNLEEHLNARSSISIRPAPTTRFLVNRSIYNGTPLYFGNIENLAFEAVFIPEHSWWNPELPANKFAYVLQHEQIHFALVELLARRITKEKENYRTGLPIIEYTAQEAKNQLLKWTQDIINSYHKELIREHTDFDTDTSLYYSPKFQQQWWNDIQLRLQETQQQDSPALQSSDYQK